MGKELEGSAYLDPNRLPMLKHTLFSKKIRRIQKKFDGETQALRGALIADLEELYQWAIKKAKRAKKQKHRQKWSRIATYIARCINVIMRDYDAVKISEKLKELKRLVENELLRDREKGN